MIHTLPLIVVITTGGTIASRVDPGSGAVSAVASADELIEMVPDIPNIARIELKPWAMVNSWNITPQMMFDLVQEIQTTLERPEVFGVVVTHGTDTVEETGMMAEFLIDSDKPLVFVAAMRNLSELGTDGPRNLLDAVSVAADPASVGRGPLVVINETIHAARYVVKANTVNPSTFLSPDYGPVGLIPANGLRYLHAAPQRRTLDVSALAGPVHIIKAVSGSDSSLLDWLIDQRTAGIVLEGSGAGNVPAAMVPGIRRAIDADIPVVLTSRVLWGFLSATYGAGGASGGGFDLVQLGVIPASHLPSPKARILLMLATSAGLSIDEIRDIFGAT